MPNPEGGNQTVDSGEPTLEPQGQPQPVRQQEGQFQTPEQVQGAPDTQFQVPDKFQGKTVEDVAKSYVELEKQFGKSNERYGKLQKELNDLRSAILANQGQMRTVGPDRQPQQVQAPTSLPQDKGNFVDNLLSDNGEQYLESKMISALGKYQQAYQQATEQQLQAYRQGIEQTSTSIMRQVADENDLDFSFVEKAVNQEFLRDKELVSRVYYQPHTITYEELDKGVRDLFSKAKESKKKELQRDLQEFGGLDKETIKLLTESRKQAASNATPSSASANPTGSLDDLSKKGNVAKWLTGEL
jgi:vacuolar-type H+-ATPase subunit I/STV1